MGVSIPFIRFSCISLPLISISRGPPFEAAYGSGSGVARILLQGARARSARVPNSASNRTFSFGGQWGAMVFGREHSVGTTRVLLLRTILVKSVGRVCRTGLTTVKRVIDFSIFDLGSYP